MRQSIQVPRWIIEEATKGADHARTMEINALKLQRLDTLLHRLLPFGLVLGFLVASVIVAFINPILGSAGVAATMAGVLIAYLTGREPTATPADDQRE